jgi:hypothetical protein
VVLQDATQVVTVEFFPEGKKHDGTERSSVKFQWKQGDMQEARYWEIFTGQLDYTPKYKYQVSVNVKGSLFSAGMSWTGPMVEGQGNGPLMIHVPRQDEAGVVSKKMTPREIAMDFDGAKPSSKPSKPGSSTTPPPKGMYVGTEGELVTPPGGNGKTTATPPGQKSRTISGYDIGEPVSAPPPGSVRESKSVDGKSKKETKAEKLKRLTGEQGWITG